MTHRACRTLAALTALILAHSACAAELFVDQKHPQANDKNPGTEALPLKTIPAAVQKAQPGDTIWVKAEPQKAHPNCLELGGE